MSSAESPAASATDGLIEVGIVLAGSFDEVDRRAILEAREQAETFLKDRYPDFHFKLLRIQRPELTGIGRVEPSELLQQAVQDRDALHWDFAFVFTAAEIAGKYSPFCFAALSRPLDAAVVSLSLIDPRANDPEVDDATRVETIARRLSRLMLHALGHLTGLSASPQSENLMFHPSVADELDAMELLSEEQEDRQRSALLEIADLRLEEGGGSQLSTPIFAIRACWINRFEILEAVWAARPWEFPKRLSRLTIASVSTLGILLLTAEAWDLALSQSPLRIMTMVWFSLIVTTFYVIVRQQLLVRRSRRRSEQTVVTSVSALAIVFVGMLVTWCTLLLIGAGVGWLLFRPDLIVSWAASNEMRASQADMGVTMQMSVFSASLGLLIGALGASFESQNYFRHVIFVDEEI